MNPTANNSLVRSACILAAVLAWACQKKVAVDGENVGDMKGRLAEQGGDPAPATAEIAAENAGSAPSTGGEDVDGSVPGTSTTETVTDASTGATTDTGTAGFTISSSSGSATSANPVVTWHAIEGAATYTVTVGRDPACSEVEYSYSSLTTTSQVVGPLAEGTHYVCIAATLASGATVQAENSGAAITVDLTIGFTAPPATSNDPTPTFELEAVEGASTYSVRVCAVADQTCANPVQILTEITSASITLGVISDGTYYVAIDALDGEGRLLVTEGHAFDMTIDTTAPGAFTLTGPATSVASTGLVTWSSSDGANTFDVQIDDDAGCPSPLRSVTATTAMQASLTGLADGTYFACVRAKDEAGNETSALNDSLTFSIDSIPPGAFALTAPLTTLATAAPVVTWGGAADATTYDVRIDDSAGCPSPVESHTDVAATSKAFGSLADGIYYVCVDAKDAAGNIRAASNDSASFAIDTTPPAAFAITTPATPTNNTTPTVTWAAASGAVKYDLRVDDTSSCSSADQTYLDITGTSQALTVLAQGGWYLCVIAKDAVGNSISATNAPYAFTIDTAPPGAFSIGGPASLTNGSTPTVTWSAAPGAATYDVKVDDASDCATPAQTHLDIAATSRALTSLADGAWYVCITAKDGAGNATSASNDAYDFTVDTLAPNTSLGSTPDASTVSSSASFAFSCDQAPCTFQYRIDGGGWTTSTSPVSLSSLAVGSHTFEVKATDAAGNSDASAASYAWSITAVSLALAKVYPTFGVNWNDYIRNDDNGADIYHQDDVACIGTETVGDPPCVHGAELIKVTATGLATCSGKTASDALGVFDWTCSAATNPVVFYSSGFKAGKGLGDLINGTAWRTNSVTVFDGATTLASTSSTAWWSNSIAALTDNSGAGASAVTLSASGTIYVLGASRASQGYIIDADKVALVVLPGATLSYGGRNFKNASFGAEAGSTFRVLIAQGSQKFGWIEGGLSKGSSGTLPEYVIFFNGSKFDQLHQVVGSGTIQLEGEAYSKLTNIEFPCLSLWQVEFMSVDTLTSVGCDTHAIYVQGSDSSSFSHISVSSSGATAFATDGSVFTNNRIYDLKASQTSNGNAALQIAGVSANNNSNVIQRVRTSNSISGGVWVEGSENIVVDVLSTSSVWSSGIDIKGSNGTYLGATIVNRSWAADGGVYLDVGADSNTVASMLMVNVPGAGVLVKSNANQIADIIVTNAGSYGINLTGNAAGNVFSGTLVLGDNAPGNCDNTSGGVNPGLADGTCANQGTSTATLLTGVSAPLFVGRVTTDDAVNTSDNLGFASYPASPLTFDWLDVANEFRTWGIESLVAFGVDGRWTSGNGRLWDWRLGAADTVARNRSYDAANGNGTFTAGAVCPAAVHGNVALTDSQTPPHTFLRHAREIWGDNIGDDNGLCESSEACLYAPNIGAYIGEGSYAANSCVFQGGAVTNVTMYAYTTNGG